MEPTRSRGARSRHLEPAGNGRKPSVLTEQNRASHIKGLKHSWLLYVAVGYLGHTKPVKQRAGTSIKSSGRCKNDSAICGDGENMIDTAHADVGAAYLELLKKTLTRWGDTEIVRIQPGSALKRALVSLIEQKGAELVRRKPFDAQAREHGLDHPEEAETMIGMKRLNNLEECIRKVVADNVRGDLVETGVWRGGASIFMRAVLRVLGASDRVVWCADSFQGLPPPDLTKYPQDKEADAWHEMPHLRVSVEQVKANFEKYGMLDDNVRFLKGWFKDTLPTAPIERLSILRLDGDLYESTMDALNGLYHKLSPGGFAIIDDYGMPQPICRAAVHDFRDKHGITSPIIDIDGTGAFWRKEESSG